MRRIKLLCGLLVAGVALVAAGAPHWSNPVLPGADPHALVVGNEVWIYPTWTDGPGQRFFAFSFTHPTNGVKHSFIRDPRSEDWLIVYHRWENQTGDGPYRGSRQVCIDRVEYETNGLIRPIVMTSGATSRP